MRSFFWLVSCLHDQCSVQCVGAGPSLASINTGFTVNTLSKVSVSALAIAVATYSIPALAGPTYSASVGASTAGGFDEDSCSNDTVGCALSASSSSIDGDFASSSAASLPGYRTVVGTNATRSGSARADAEVKETIKNTGSSAANYFYTFRVDGGQVAIDSTGGNGLATLNADLAVDGISVWSFTFELATGVSQFVSGVPLNNFSQSSSFLSWSNTYFTISLGSLDVGDDLDLSYLISATARIDADGDLVCGGYGYGVEVNQRSVREGDGDGYGEPCPSALAYASDPGVFSSPDQLPAGISSRRITTGVSEPATLALLGAGLAGMGLARRRRK
jgi:PEP-CTERM motif